MDALVAELDDILADQPTKRKTQPGAAQSKALGAQSNQNAAMKANASAAFLPSSSAAAPAASQRSASGAATTKAGRSSSGNSHNHSSYSGATGTSAFDLSDSDDDAPPARSKPGAAAAPQQRSQLATKSNTSSSSSFAPSSSTSTAATATSSSRKPGAARASTGTGSDDDLADLLSEMDSAIDHGASKPTSSSSKPRASPTGVGAGSSTASGFSATSSFSSNYARPAASSSSSSSSFGPRSKCYPTVLSSSESNGGISSGSGCSRLLCTSCDQPVIALRHQSWVDSVADYMFFRNHYPDARKLAAGLQRAPRMTAYACQCSWQSVGPDGTGGESLNLSSLDVSDRRKKEGCSAWNTLRWTCAGH